MAELQRPQPGITQGDIGPRYVRKRLQDEVYVGHFIKVGDRIRIRATIATGVIASLTTVNLTVGGRMHGMDGYLVSFGDAFTFTADGVQTAKYIMAPEGYVVDLIVQSTSTGLGSTDLIVVVDIVQGVDTTATAVGLLAFGYVYPAGLLGLNVPRNIGGGSGSGMAISGAVTGGESGSVLFVNNTGGLGQDNANFNWDDANNQLKVQSGVAGVGTLGVGAAPSGSGYMEIRSTNDMQVLSSALDILASDDGGALTSIFGAQYVSARTRHTSGVLGTVRSLLANVGPVTDGGTVTNAQGIRIFLDDMTHVTNARGLTIDNVTGATNNFAIVTGLGQVSFGDVVRVPGVAIASLPASPLVGMIMRVTDSLVPVIGNTVSAGGAAPALVWYNGTNWTVIGK